MFLPKNPHKTNLLLTRSLYCEPPLGKQCNCYKPNQERHHRGHHPGDRRARAHGRGGDPEVAFARLWSVLVHWARQVHRAHRRATDALACALGPANGRAIDRGRGRRRARWTSQLTPIRVSRWWGGRCRPTAAAPTRPISYTNFRCEDEHHQDQKLNPHSRARLMRGEELT